MRGPGNLRQNKMLALISTLAWSFAAAANPLSCESPLEIVRLFNSLQSKFCFLIPNSLMARINFNQCHTRCWTWHDVESDVDVGLQRAKFRYLSNIYKKRLSVVRYIVYISFISFICKYIYNIYNVLLLYYEKRLFLVCVVAWRNKVARNVNNHDATTTTAATTATPYIFVETQRSRPCRTFHFQRWARAHQVDTALRQHRRTSISIQISVTPRMCLRLITLRVSIRLDRCQAQFGDRSVLPSVGAPT